VVNACGVRTRCGGTAEGEVPFEEVCVQRGGVEVWRGVGGKFGGFFYYGLEKRAISRDFCMGWLWWLSVQMRFIVGLLELNCPTVVILGCKEICDNEL
jgi:hypothetical protein